MPWGVRLGSHQRPSLLLDSAGLCQNWGMAHHFSHPCVRVLFHVFRNK